MQCGRPLQQSKAETRSQSRVTEAAGWLSVGAPVSHATGTRLSLPAAGSNTTREKLLWLPTHLQPMFRNNQELAFVIPGRPSRSSRSIWRITIELTRTYDNIEPLVCPLCTCRARLTACTVVSFSERFKAELRG